MTLFLQLPNETELITVNCDYTSVINNFSSTRPSNFVSQNNTDIIINPCFWSTVPNVIRYRFNYTNNEFIALDINNQIHPDSNYNEEFLYFNDNHRTIVIVLESPHVDEYTSDMQSISPAQGKTGTKIHSDIGDLLNRIKNHLDFTENEIIEIALVNPIPLQTSLGTIHGESLSNNTTLRNNVWRSIWEHTDYDEKFIQLINTLQARDVVINACTTALKKRVSTALSEAESFKGAIFNTYHPGAWGNWLSGFKKIRLSSTPT